MMGIYNGKTKAFIKILNKNKTPIIVGKIYAKIKIKTLRLKMDLFKVNIKLFFIDIKRKWKSWINKK